MLCSHRAPSIARQISNQCALNRFAFLICNSIVHGSSNRYPTFHVWNAVRTNPYWSKLKEYLHSGHYVIDNQYLLDLLTFHWFIIFNHWSHATLGCVTLYLIVDEVQWLLELQSCSQLMHYFWMFWQNIRNMSICTVSALRLTEKISWTNLFGSSILAHQVLLTLPSHIHLTLWYVF